MQRWYALSNLAMKGALYEIESMRRFAQQELFNDALLDETAIIEFRRSLERHVLTLTMIDIINDTLEERRLLMTGGTMVDATIIQAAQSTKNREKQRVPVMHLTEKSNEWHFGMKVQVGTNGRSRQAYTVSMTSANAAEATDFPHFLRENDRAVFGDKGYANNLFKRAGCKAGMFWVCHSRQPSLHPMNATNKRFNLQTSSTQTRVEHLLRVIKRQFNYTKALHKGLARNVAQIY